MISFKLLALDASNTNVQQLRLNKPHFIVRPKLHVSWMCIWLHHVCILHSSVFCCSDLIARSRFLATFYGQFDVAVAGHQNVTRWIDPIWIQTWQSWHDFVLWVAYSINQGENPRFYHCFHDEDGMMWLKSALSCYSETYERNFEIYLAVALVITPTSLIEIRTVS